MVPEADIKVDKQVIADFLAEVVNGWDELPEPAVLELRCLFPEKTPNITHFRPTESGLSDLADHATEMNRYGLNCYIVINPVRASVMGRPAKDDDVIGSHYFWADGDDEEAAHSIRNFAGPKYNMAVMTGRIPSPRPHIYWRTDEWVFNMPAWVGIQKAIASRLSTDRTVVNPSRVMRLAGTINWPTEKKAAMGRVAELTTFRTEYDDDREPVSFEQMRRAFGDGPKPSLSQQAHHVSGLHIDTGPQAMDREDARIRALSGEQWNIEVFRLVGSYVRAGLGDGDILTLTERLTLPGYTIDQTHREVQSMIDRTRSNPKFEEVKPYASLSIDTGEAVSFDAPSVPVSLEWFDEIEPSLIDAYLVKGVLSDGAMSVIYGPSNSGKTFFAMDLAFHVAVGAAWRGRKVKQAAVLYLAAEGGRGVLNRVAALRLQHGISSVPLAVKRAGMDLLHDQADLKQIVALAEEVKRRAAGLPLVIVIDTLSRIMAGGDENSAADMTALIRNIDAVREVTGAHIVLVHHTGKDAAKGARGHSSLRAATDTEIEVSNEGGARAATVTKQRDYQGGEVFAFSLKSIFLGIDNDGDEVSSCVIEEQDGEEYMAAQKSSKGVGGNQKIILDTFDQMVAEGLGRPNPSGVGFPEIGRFMCVPVEDLRAHCEGKFTAKNKRGTWSDAWKALSDARGVMCIASDLVWRADRKINR